MRATNLHELCEMEGMKICSSVAENPGVERRLVAPRPWCCWPCLKKKKRLHNNKLDVIT